MHMTTDIQIQHRSQTVFQDFMNKISYLWSASFAVSRGVALEEKTGHFACNLCGY